MLSDDIYPPVVTGWDPVYCGLPYVQAKDKHFTTPQQVPHGIDIHQSSIFSEIIKELPRVAINGIRCPS